MQNQFSTIQPNKIREQINALLKDFNFFDNSLSLLIIF